MLTLVVGASGARAQDVDFHMMARKAVEKSVPLLQKGAVDWTERSNGACFSCHNQSLPAMAVGLARDKGYAVDPKAQKEVAQFVYRFFDQGKEMLQKALTDPAMDRQATLKLVDPPVVVGYALATLEAAQWPSDETTAAMARFLAFRQAADGRWVVPAARPPMEGSEFAATALAVRGLKHYMPKAYAAEATKRIGKARKWLAATRPRSTEDKAFRLLGLRWSNVGEPEIRKAVRELLDEQKDDGGWSQLPNLASDAYATGQVLVALTLAGGLPVSDAAYSRGFLYLVGTQKEDGSWLVQPRTVAFQPYFDAGFPHEKAQFISCAGSSWATMALALATPGEAAAGPTKTASAGKP
jgi:hypothetical protein